MKLTDVTDVYTSAGEGISGTIHGSRIYLGNEKFLQKNQIDVRELSVSALSRAYTLIGWGGKVKALFCFDEKIREEAHETLELLKKQNLEVGVLTGDGSAASSIIPLGISSVTGMTPEQKYRWIQEWERNHGPALVVGEGLNDAPMLAGAGVSLAIRGALEKTRDAADFVLPDDDLRQIPWLIQTARSTMRNIRQNLFWAFFYNLLAVPLAVWGRVNPVAAALLMIGSSVFIIVHSLRDDKNKRVIS